MVEINNKKLCESCFCETDALPCPHCGFSADKYSADLMVLPMGTRLEDKIVIGKVMGKGGFGITYLGYDTKMERKVAVKEYYPNGIAYRTTVGTEVSVADTKFLNTFAKGAEKFYDEARTVAKFNGNYNIVDVYDFFRTNNTVYLIMEYLNGITLKNYIKKHGKLSDGQALFIMDKITDALKAIHNEKVLHRDISPDNIMICTNEIVKLIDFGAARQIMAESSSNLTVIMKHGYTPIEQYSKKGSQGAWTDIYSLGASIYHALTDVLIDDPYSRLADDSEFAENKRGINDDLWDILKKCTMINKEERFGSAIELKKALTSVSASIKPEPIVLNKDDLREDDFEKDSGGNEGSFADIPASAADDLSPSAADEPKSDFPVTAAAVAVDESVPEVTEIPENGNDVNEKVTETDAAVKQTDTENTGSPKIKKSRKKTPVIAAVCAAVIIGSVGIFAAFSGESLFAKEAVRIDNNDPTWAMTKSIPAETIKAFDSDILVTLEVNEIKLESDYDLYSIKVMDKNCNLIPTNLSANAYDEILLYEGQTELKFVIMRESLKNINELMKFETRNVSVNAVTFEKSSDPGAYNDIKFSGLYPGDWEQSEFISKKHLQSIGGDVKITLNIEVDLYGNKAENYYKIKPLSENWEDIKVSAFNYTPESDLWYNFYTKGSKKFMFTISEDEIEKLSGKGLCFQLHNVIITSAVLEKAEQ